MSTIKTIGGALGAIIVLIVAQILAQLVASLFVLVKIPEGICNIIAGIIYVGLAFVLSELFSKRLLKIKIENLGMPKFSIKAKWIIVGVLLPVIVKAVYLFFFSGNLYLRDAEPLCGFGLREVLKIAILQQFPVSLR